MWLSNVGLGSKLEGIFMSETPKLPIVDTLTAGLIYSGGGYLKILKILALPTLILIIPVLGLTLSFGFGFMREFAESLRHGQGVPGVVFEEMILQILPLMGLYPLFILGSLLFYAMVAVPMNRDIVLGEMPGFLRLDRYVWRVFFAQILLILLVIPVVLLFGLTVGALSALSGGEPSPALLAPLIFALVAAAIYFLVRISLFLVHVSVTGEFRVREAFGLTRGSFWRLLGTFILMALAVLAFGMIFQTVFYLVGVPGFVGDLSTLDETALEENPLLLLDVLVGFVTGPIGIVLGGLYALYYAFITAFQIAIPAHLYRHLAGDVEALEHSAEDLDI
jgi:hypothetical protein